MASWLKGLIGRKNGDDSLREALEDYIEELSSEDSAGDNGQEKILLGNILELRNMTVTDVMVPRVDVAAVDISSSPSELLRLLAENSTAAFPSTAKRSTIFSASSTSRMC